MAIILIFYTIIGGFLIKAPVVDNLYETIRNLFFHVSIWFAMFILLIISVVYSIKYLNSLRPFHDMMASSFAVTAIVFGLIGVATGSVWARFTWGAWWTFDPKLTATSISLLIYLAYLLLRASIDSDEQKARISAVYNIFAFAAVVPLIFVLPRLTDSLHPGNGGNPGFNAYDLDNNLRKVFYPSVFAWTLLGVWLASIKVRTKVLEEKTLEIN